MINIVYFLLYLLQSITAAISESGVQVSLPIQKCWFSLCM